MQSPAGARALTAAIAAVLLCLGLGACGSDTEDAAAAADVPAAAAPATVAEQIAAVGLRSNDLRGRAAIKPSVAGGSMKQPTFDQCGYRFTSEKQRKARRQVEVTGGDQAASYSNEVVAYRDAAAAEKAMSELAEALGTCDPRTPVTSFGLGPTRFDVLRADTAPAELPVKASVRVLEKLTVTNGKSLFVLLTYQQSGAMIDANYLVTSATPTADQITELGRQATLTGNRLQATATG